MVCLELQRGQENKRKKEKRNYVINVVNGT